MKKIKPLTIIALSLLAISVSMLDFSNLTWEVNYKSYGGLIGFLILISFDFYLRFKKR